MKSVIEQIFKRTTEYSHPSQATTTANALDLLSSGIYTEEERFIFELLQNAVDSFDIKKQSMLSIKIIITDDYLVFMHNGTPFSERDLEGLCDIGNGNKMTDAKKIGYKGIGFKSVFMHSHRVTVLTDSTCFKFDKEVCDKLVKSKGDTYKDVKLPWQIIPISTEVPLDVDTNGFNVVTYIETSNRQSLKRKVEKLLNDTRFLLFLKIDDLRISFFDGTNEILTLSKSLSDGVLILSKNGLPQNSWLIYPEKVKLTSEIKEALNRDAKTPTKLKDSQFMEISFAIALDKDKNILPLNDAVMYTYLPTSFSFGLNFIVNANFITDAGRQQIIKDCAWNEFIFAQIPALYLNWISNTISPNYTDWYKVLPCISKNDDELSIAYMHSLKNAINTIPFVRTNNGKQILLKEAIEDHYELYRAIPQDVYNSFVTDEVSSIASYNTLLSDEVGKALGIYGITSVEKSHIRKFIEFTEQYLADITDEEMLVFLDWLKNVGENVISKRDLAYSKIIPNEEKRFTEPVNLFFSSEYVKENPEMSKDAQILSLSLSQKLTESHINWLRDLGIQELSNISLIKEVFCKKGYICKDNAIKILQFIFDCEQKEHILDVLTKSEVATLLLLTKNGNLEKADNLFMDSFYGIRMNEESDILNDYFISSEYVKKQDDIFKWQLFFRKIGVNTEIGVKKRIFDNQSELYNLLSSYVDYCSTHEKNYGYSIHRGGLFVNIYIQAQLPPILNFVSDSFVTCKFVWSNVMGNPVSLDNNADHIAGHTGFGYYAYGYLKDNVDGHRYLGELLLPYILRTCNLLPGTDGLLHKSVELLAPTEENFQILGTYLPTLDIKFIDKTWYDIIKFKTQIVLEDYLDILCAISQDYKNLSENKSRLNYLYERIADTWDFSQGTNEYTIVHNWGEGHKILSKEGTFEIPSSLYLLSSRLSGVDIAHQVFHGKHLENERFVSFMTAMGVKLITDHSVEGLNNAILDNNITDKLKMRLDFLTSIAVGDTFTPDLWEEAKSKMYIAIDNLEFYSVETINICYGSQVFNKTTYSAGNKFYYVGKFGLVNQELLHGAIIDEIGIPKKARTVFLTILQMDNLEELKEYLEQKGYDTSFIQIQHEIVPIENNSIAIMRGESASYGGLTHETMRIALEEAKETILQKLEKDGYDISHKEWDGWTCINGITKAGIEYPLVIRSNKSHRNTCITPTDWNQLMKPNAMFAVVTNNGVGTISFRDLLKTKENMTIRFSSNNIDLDTHITELSKVFTYFKGIQFDFNSYVPSTINRWERFMAPEQHTDELPQATTLTLPE